MRAGMDAPMPQTIIPHPSNGTPFFGQIEEKNVRGFLIPAAPIILRRGKASRHGGFGVRHIWAWHATEMRTCGYTREDQVADYVADIVCPGSAVLCEFEIRRDTRVTVARSAIGVAVLEHKEGRDGICVYSVVTAFAQRNPHGTRVGSIAAYNPDEWGAL